MSMSRSKDALIDYFNDLLGYTPPKDAAEAPDQRIAQSQPPTQPLIQSSTRSLVKPSVRKKDDEVPTVNTVGQVQKASKQINHSKSSEFNNQSVQQVRQRQMASPVSALGESQLDEREPLQEEQKQKLQALLSQQALELTATAPKEIRTKTEHLPEQKHALQPEPEITEIKTTDEATTDADLSSQVVEQDADQKEAYDAFHSELVHKVEWAENGRPVWAQENFDALLFNVGGLTLAVPLITLGQIVPLDRDALTPIFGQSDWFVGIQPTSLGKLRIVNTALFVMPEKYDASFLEDTEFAISLDGCPWALAVNKVNQPVRLNPDEIKWRSERSKRPWLAGTVKSAMCALLDVPKMARILNQSDKQLGGANRP